MELDETSIMKKPELLKIPLGILTGALPLYLNEAVIANESPLK